MPLFDSVKTQEMVATSLAIKVGINSLSLFSLGWSLLIYTMLWFSYI